MTDVGEKPHPWAPVPGIDDVYDEPKTTDDAYEMKQVENPSSVDETDCEFMLDILIPSRWQRRWLRRSTTVKLWTPATGWKKVARFTNPIAAYHYAQYISERVLREKNAETRR